MMGAMRTHKIEMVIVELGLLGKSSEINLNLIFTYMIHVIGSNAESRLLYVYLPFHENKMLCNMTNINNVQQEETQK